MKAILAPSLLSSTLARAAEVAIALENAGVKWLHLDVMDGSFVPNITFGAPFIASLRKECSLFLDVHLMIMEPGRYLEAFASAGADLLVIHLEACRHPQKALSQIREMGLKAGIALDPDSDPSRLRWLLPYLDMILLMGVNPGFSGQKFIPETIEKTRCCREYLVRNGYASLPIQVDGGVCLANARALIEAGATILVSGSAFFKAGDYRLANAAFERTFAAASPDADSLAALEIAAAWRPAAAR